MHTFSAGSPRAEKTPLFGRRVGMLCRQHIVFASAFCYNTHSFTLWEIRIPGAGTKQKGVLFMALWIIAIVLIIVFFPILFSVAATAAMIIIPLAMLAFSVGSIIYFAGAAVANPKLGRCVGLGIMIFHIFFQLSPIRHWMYRHNNGFFYYMAPIVVAYAVCLPMLSRNRGMGGRKGIWGISFLLLGALFLTGMEIATDGMSGYTLFNVPVHLMMILGYVLLLAVSAHSEASADEKNGVLLITLGFLADEVRAILLTFGSIALEAGVPIVITHIVVPIRYGSLLLLIVGTVLYAKSVLGGVKNKKE